MSQLRSRSGWVPVSGQPVNREDPMDLQEPCISMLTTFLGCRDAMGMGPSGRFGAGKQLGSFAPRNELAPGSSTNQMSSVAKLEKFDSNTLCVFSGLLQKQECQVKLKAGY